MIDDMASDHERLGTLLAEGVDHHRAGRIVEAAKAYRAALVLVPGQADALHLLGLIAHDAGDVEGAVERVAAAVAAKPEVLPFQTTLLRVVADALDREVLRRALARAQRRHPDSAILAEQLGHVCRRGGDDRAAAAAYRATLAADPTHRDAALHLASAELRRGRRGAAEAALREAAAHHPDDIELQARFGNLLRARGRREEAVEVLSAIAARHPEQAGLANDLSIALREKGSLVSARRVLERATVLDPTLAPVWVNLSNVLRDLGEAEAAGDAIERALALDPSDRAVGQNRLLQAHQRRRFDGVAQRGAAEDWAALLPPAAAPASFANPLDPDRGLTIGLLGDLDRDPVATCLAGVLPAIDRKRFQIVAYDVRGGANATVERLRRHVDAWVPIADMEDGAVVDRIRGDGVDVLIDLSGHRPGNRLGVFARRAAPVQATWLGHPGTTGVAAIDHLLADPVTVPPAEDAWYSERVRRLPHVLVALGVPDVALDPGPLPMGHDRPPTFGSVNDLARLSDRTIALWGRIFGALPGARLILKARQLADAEVAAWMLARLAAAGIPSGSVTIEGPTARGDYFARYREIDLLLDATPVGGGISTAEAMWMGVPSVRLRGDRFAGRLGESFLRAVGLDEFVCADAEAYVACAVGWAGRRADLAALRASLRQRLFASPGGDVGAFARDLEACWREMWRERCAAG